MNNKVLAANFNVLAPEERFRLVFAAGARQDDVEQQRLMRSAPKKKFVVGDYIPYSNAFDEVAQLAYLDLLEKAQQYVDAWRDVEPFVANSAGDGATASCPESSASDAAAAPADRRMNLALVYGFMLKTNADGWQLFCERLCLPPYVLWKVLPGFARLQRALAVAQEAAFVPEDMLRWLNETRPPGTPEVTDVVLTPAKVAAELDQFFRERACWWGGK